MRQLFPVQLFSCLNDLPARRRHKPLLALAVASIWAALSLPGSVGVVHAQQGPAALAQDAGEAEPKRPDSAVKPRPNARIVIPLRDNPDKRITGQVQWFDLEQVAYLDSDKKPQQVAWDALDPERLPRVLNRLPDIRDADSLMVAAELMIEYGGEEHAITRMFAYAVRNDPDKQEQVDELLERLNGRGNGGDDPADTPEDEQEQPDEGEGAGGGGEGDEPGKIKPGELNPRAWPNQTKAQSEAAVERLAKQTDEVLAKMNHKMGSTQTERFLVYSDMPRKESRYWVSLLDKMYVRLCEVFDLDKDKNIWNGKCLLLFFNDREDFLKYNQTAYGSNPAGAAGICWQFGNGDVHISMWRQQQEKELAHTLVHEAVHGFLFRYQSSHHVPNWLNEGLAEYISVSLVDAPRYPRRANDARSFVKKRGRLDNFLSAQNIIGEHYGLAYDVTDLMVEENRKGYVAMIQGIKEGLSAEESFEQKYGAAIDRVFQYYAKSRLRMDNLRMD